MEELTKFLSPCRLEKYKLADETFEQAFVRYQWNLQLGESLLPALCYVEIGIRNGLNRAITLLFGQNWLLNSPQRLKLRQSDIEQIEGITKEILTEKQRSVTHDDIVAKLGFGFWGAFFQKSYDTILWQNPQAFATIFPNLQRSLRTRKYIAPKLHSIRFLRNRIAHHEPIFHLQPDAQVAHQACLELIHAMSLAAAQRLTQIDRFHNTYAAGVHLVTPHSKPEIK
jgi:Abi-like protein